jgi:hypothetical protein
MIGVSVVFDCDGDFDRSRVLEVARNARTMFEGMPGLRFKVFTLDEKQQQAMNFYVWDSSGSDQCRGSGSTTPWRNRFFRQPFSPPKSAGSSTPGPAQGAGPRRAFFEHLERRSRSGHTRRSAVTAGAQCDALDHADHHRQGRHKQT